MAHLHYQQFPQTSLQYQDDPHQQTLCTQVIKAATAFTAGGSFLVVAALIMTGTVIALTIVTPLLVIFSPVLVPALITVSVLSLGFLASGGLCVTAITVLTWIYGYVTGKHPPGADQLDSARDKLLNKARDKVRDNFLKALDKLSNKALDKLSQALKPGA